jgi:hypothetical protein
MLRVDPPEIRFENRSGREDDPPLVRVDVGQTLTPTSARSLRLAMHRERIVKME